jgi:hypothetical protein
MSRKRRHDPDNGEGQSLSPLKPLKRSKYNGNVEATRPTRRRTAEKPKDNPLTAIRCFICASTSNEGLLPLKYQLHGLVPRCHQNCGVWMAHRTCARLLDGAYVFKPSNSEKEVVGGLRNIDPRRFKLVRPPLPPWFSISDKLYRNVLYARTPR